MLVLLVMFILLVPTLTHEVPLDLPQPGPVSSLPIETHRLVLARDGATSLDGQALDEAALATRLHALAGQRQAVLTMRTDPEARYERLDQVLATVKRAGVTRWGLRAGVKWSGSFAVNG